MGIREAVNELLSQARLLRRNADETKQPDYRAKFLKLARQVEARATEIEAEAPDE